MENQIFLKGDVVSIEGKTGVYVVVQVMPSGVKLVRVKKQEGFPIAGNKIVYGYGPDEFEKLVKIDHCASYETLSFDDVLVQKENAYKTSKSKGYAGSPLIPLTRDVKIRFIGYYEEIEDIRNGSGAGDPSKFSKEFAERQTKYFWKLWKRLEFEIGQPVPVDAVKTFKQELKNS